MPDQINCGLPFALSLLLPPMAAAERLPDPFEAECPICHHQATYPKSAIRILVATRRR